MNKDKSQTKESQEQTVNRPWLFQPGKSGNPGGRPKGSKSLKTFAKEYLESLPDEEKIEFMRGLDKTDVWKMAEGNPKQDTEIRGNLTISEVLDNLDGQKVSGQDVEIESLVQDTKQGGPVDSIQTEQGAKRLSFEKVESESDSKV